MTKITSGNERRIFNLINWRTATRQERFSHWRKFLATSFFFLFSVTSAFVAPTHKKWRNPSWWRILWLRTTVLLFSYPRLRPSWPANIPFLGLTVVPRLLPCRAAGWRLPLLLLPPVLMLPNAFMTCAAVPKPPPVSEVIRKYPILIGLNQFE